MCNQISFSTWKILIIWYNSSRWEKWLNFNLDYFLNIDKLPKLLWKAVVYPSTAAFPFWKLLRFTDCYVQALVVNDLLTLESKILCWLTLHPMLYCSSNGRSLFFLRQFFGLEKRHKLTKNTSGGGSCARKDHIGMYRV